MSDIEDKIRALDKSKDKYDPNLPSVGSVYVRISDVQALIAQQVKEAKRDFINDICDVEATREAEGKDFISWEAFERIKAIGDNK